MTKIYLAGSEVETLSRALLDCGVKNVLWSFYYLHMMKRTEAALRFIEANPQCSFFLDSGAFTYWAKFKTEPDKLMPWRRYKELYFQYIHRSWEMWDRVTELDFDDMREEAMALGIKGFEDVTLDMVDEWREEMFATWPKAKIMTVWHGSRGLQDWSLYCRDDRYKYLGIGSGLPDIGLHRKMVMEAHRWQKPVHGFGMTRVNTALTMLPYDSVDSTSWLMSQKYGTTFIFKDNTFRLLGKDSFLGKRAKRLYRRYFEAIGCDWGKIEADDVAENRKASIIAWKRVSDRLEYMRSRERRRMSDDPNIIGELNPNYTFDRAEPRAQIEEPKQYSRPRGPEGVVSRLLSRNAHHVGPRPKERTGEEESKRAQWRPPPEEDV